MIFVSIGTHPGQFTRLIKKIDSIAPKIKEKIIIQRGFTKYTPKNVEFIEFTDDIDKYFKKARLVLVQSATSLIETSLKHRKPLITIPRLKRYGEHINDHQVEFAEYVSEKYGVKSIIDIDELTPELLKNYNKKMKTDRKGLVKIQKYLSKILEGVE